MDYATILTYLAGLTPWLNYAFIILGALVVIGTAIDATISDDKDGGFMKKLLAIPILGIVLEALTRFSPFNFTPKSK